MSDEKVIKPESDWKEQLTPTQYQVLREKGTEPPFTGEYVHHKADGTYTCAACGQELFDRILNSIPAAVGRASTMPSTRTKSNCAPTIATAWSAWKFFAAAAADTSAMSFPMGRSLPGSATASIRPAWISRRKERAGNRNDQRRL